MLTSYHTQLSSFELITSVCAIVAVVRFYKGTKTMTVEQRPSLKLLTFKLIVFLWTIQNVSKQPIQSQWGALTTLPGNLQLPNIEW